MLESEEALQKRENFIEIRLRNGVVFDVEEAAFFACASDFFGNGFSLSQSAIDVAHVDCRDGREACGCFGNFAICGFRSRMKVDVFATLFKETISLIFRKILLIVIDLPARPS